MNEPRNRKKKWSKDPRNLNWVNDKGRFSVKMMEKMGWTEGKGLGADESGRSENIKVDLRPRQLGLGSSNYYGDTWLGHLDAFNAILSQLNNKKNDGGETKNEEEDSKAGVKEEAEAKPAPVQVRSLVETATAARGRCRYAKRKKGKDLAGANDNDLKSIFGFEPAGVVLKPIKNEQVKQEVKEEAEEKEEEEEPVEKKAEVEKLDMNFTTSKMSTVDYFSSKKYYEKLAALTNPTRKNQYIDMIKQEAAENEEIRKAKLMSEVKVKEEPADDGYPQADPAAGCIKKKKKKSKKSKSQICEEEANNEQVCERSQETSEKKKKKKKSKTPEAEILAAPASEGEISNQKETEAPKKKKKSKKNRAEDAEIEAVEAAACVAESGDSGEKKKKKRKRPKSSASEAACAEPEVKKSKKIKKNSTAEAELAAATTTKAEEPEKKKKKRKKNSE